MPMNETFDLIPLLPEIFVFGMACVILLVTSTAPPIRARRRSC